MDTHPIIYKCTHTSSCPWCAGRRVETRRENEEEEEALVVGGGDMYLQREENLGQIDTHAIIHIYAYTHGVCVCSRSSRNGTSRSCRCV